MTAFLRSDLLLLQPDPASGTFTLPLIDLLPSALPLAPDAEEPPYQEGDEALYALLEPARVTLLAQRAEMADLAHIRLYRPRSGNALRSGENDDSYEDSGPWLVRLGQRDRFSAAILAGKPGEWDQQHLLTSGAGIFIRSRLGLTALAEHLRHYIMLAETDTGVRLFFRLQEPGFLEALLAASVPQVIEDFFLALDAFSHWRPSFHGTAGEIVTIGATMALPEHSRAPAQRALPGLGPVERAALNAALFARQARDLALTDGDTPDERQSRYQTYLRLMRAGFDNPPTLAEAWRLEHRLPPDILPIYWQTIESGQYSLRFILVNYAGDYGLMEVMDQ